MAEEAYGEKGKKLKEKVKKRTYKLSDSEIDYIPMGDDLLPEAPSYADQRPIRGTSRAISTEELSHILEELNIASNTPAQ